MEELQRRAFLEFCSNQEFWRLSEPFAKVVEEHVDLQPAIFRLPWPVDMIPAVGTEFSSGDLPADLSGTVQGVEYAYYPGKKSITVEVAISGESVDEWHDFDDQYLICLAEAGMLIFPDTSITEILRDAGLPTTRAEWKATKQ